MSACPCCGGQNPSSSKTLDCKFCGHRWRLVDTTTEVVYQNMADRNAWPAQMLEKKFTDRMNDLRPRLKNGQKILEVGCAEGALGEIAKAEFTLTYIGVEPSQDAAKAKLLLDQVTASSKDLKDKFDLILSFHVLEHIKDPRDEVQRWATLLSQNPEARLMIEVPHESGHALLSNDLNQEHLHQFTVASLAALLQSAHFQIESLSTGHFESPGYSDSLRATARLALSPAQKKSNLVERFNKKFPEGFYVWGTGGDFRNYILPVIDELKIKGLIDSNPQAQGARFGAHEVTAFNPALHLNANVIIASLRFKPEIQASMISCGKNPATISGVDEIL